MPLLKQNETLPDPDARCQEETPPQQRDLLLYLTAQDEKERRFDNLLRSIKQEDMIRRSRSRSRSIQKRCTFGVRHARGNQVNWEEARIAVMFEMKKIQFDERIFAKPSTKSLQTEMDLDYSQEEFYHRCSDRIDSIFKCPECEDLDFYIGVTETPERRFYTQGGHCEKYHSMHIVGVHVRSRLIASVEKTLIHTKKELFSYRCKNKGKGGEHIDLKRDVVRFLYLCIGDASAIRDKPSMAAVGQLPWFF